VQVLQSEMIQLMGTNIEMVLSARSVDTLVQIDQVVAELSMHTTLLRLHSALLNKALISIPTTRELVDPEGQIRPQLEELHNKVKRVQDTLTARLSVIQMSDDVHLDDGLVDAMSFTIDAATDLTNLIVELTMAVEKHDLAFSNDAGTTAPGAEVFDLNRMKKAVAGESIVMPSGLTREEKRQLILANAKK